MPCLPSSCSAAAAACSAFVLVAAAPGAHAQAIDPYLGQIACAAFDFAPRGWAKLDGQLLPINQNQALFSLLGTTYGGNGTTNFALPDMRSRVLLHDGQGPGLTARSLGAVGGSDSATLSLAQLPAHTHALVPQGSGGAATQASPANAVPARSGTTRTSTTFAPGPGNVAMAPYTTANAGNGQPVATVAPYLVVNCFIALQGIFPSRP